MISMGLDTDANDIPREVVLEVFFGGTHLLARHRLGVALLDDRVNKFKSHRRA